MQGMTLIISVTRLWCTAMFKLTLAKASREESETRLFHWEKAFSGVLRLLFQCHAKTASIAASMLISLASLASSSMTESSP